MEQADAIIVGAGLAGLAAAAELGDRGKRVIVVDQEPRSGLGGQAFWSLGGLFMVDTPEQRRMGIRDSRELALSDWMGSAQFDRPEDAWPRKWAEAYIDFAAGEMRPWLHQMGLRWFPVVGWAERGGGFADGHGNSVPRFHITWGTGTGTMEHFARRCIEHEGAGLVSFQFRHRVDRIDMTNGAAAGVSGTVLADDTAPRGASTNRDAVGDFAFKAASVIVTSGGIGGNFEMVRKAWPTARLGPAPKEMIAGVPAHVDGRMIAISEQAGGHVINGDRMWHYTEGVKNWDPIWPAHGIRILPGPSSMWFDATGKRFAPPALPGFDSMGTLRAILATGYDYSWFVLTQKIIKKEFALSGSEQNPDFTSASWREVIRQRILSGKRATGPVEAFKAHGADFVVADDLDTLVAGMNRIGDVPLNANALRAQIVARDMQVDNPFSKDAQMMAIQAARHYRGDRLIRTAKPHRFLDPANGPLIAVKLHILTRKTLGGLQTNLDSQMIGADGAPVPGLFAAGEVAGFGGGGYHGYNALEGTFLGGCIFSGRNAGRSTAIA
ncbi:FAD-binding dehydrogenase [Pseudosulfitobacter pseudonitzschiae]|uniref:FAD-binding dehydrogenase n=1 Tax=Pseudosulfitobacter pseudonitzschiae TaxID=1402135 RepID=UPI001AF57EE3|nr:FAD-binding dehydrogenase [Pseudosulfitobacter pseudonitzschiae]MBM1815244.1 FAD-binding dehydrogenase [Pseudosulfitobacter pseudonitzschiae]MBM1832235.1 FAD-binding dehydrogenase [Pseudosulfitobacter pseudonitzschiae]MBM1837103.1 FAD-binding dehydrogenase [Pseudosulfitobacter pseudonitzschiae]MBM1841949.1 FAD-binding dehydrogenase [Pseudosulfitobacter pseudonitzschiae]MBM1846817.1 FAD-binding dehydrogenase [Pseudosulfitobacter pseudonitzschiae]